MAFTSLNPAAGVAIDRRSYILPRHFIVHHTKKKEMLSGVELTNLKFGRSSTGPTFPSERRHFAGAKMNTA